MAKDAKGHGSAGRGKKGVATDPAKRARQLAHIQAHYAAKSAKGPEEIADAHDIPTAHLHSGVDEGAAYEFAEALKEFPSSPRVF